MALSALLAALAMVALLALHNEDRAGAQTWLPEVSITSYADVTEGADAVFVVKASQASSSALAIAVNVSEWPASGSVATLADTGPKTVTIPAGQTTATLRVGTEDDSTSEPRGIIAAMLSTPGANAGYRVSQAAGWSTVVVSDNDLPTPQVSIRAWSSNSASERGGKVWFTLTPSSVPHRATTINVNVTSTGDFGVKTGAHTITLPTVGDGSTTFSVPLIDDNINEADGSVTATVQTGSGYTVGTPAAATITLFDDDTPRVSVSAGADVTEGEAATFTVSASPAPYQPLPVTLKVEASGLSGVNTGSRSVSIPTSGTATLTVATIDDNVHSQGGTITATVEAGSGYNVASSSSADVDVADNDGPVITITAGAGVTEGQDASFTVNANPAPSQWMSVNVTIAATGEIGAATGARTVNISPTGTRTFSVSTTDDNLDEPDGSVTATVKAGYGYSVGDPFSAKVAVADDEATPVSNPVITITAGPDINEGEDATFTITATPPLPAGQTLDINIIGKVPGAFNIPWTERITGGTTTITQFSVENEYDEADYPLTLILKAGVGYTLGDPSRASVTVIDDDLPKVSIRVADGWRGLTIEEDGTANFGLSVTPSSYQDVTISVQVTATGDFGVQTGTRQLTIPARKSGTSLSISPVPDHVHEADGSITVTVQPHSSYEIVGSSSGTVVVKDDDPVPGPRVSVANAPSKARAGERLQFTVTLNQPATGEVSMDYELATFSPWLWPGEDFQDDDGGVSGSLVFAAGEVEKVVNVHINPNAYFEHNDRIYIALDNLVGQASFAESFATGRLNAR